MIGLYIAYLLKQNTALTALVPAGNIYPYICNENTQLPAIIYSIDSLTPEYTKDGWVLDDCAFSVESFHEDYTKLQAVVLQVRKALELKSGTYSDMTIWRILLVGQDEEGYMDGFSNKLHFEVKIEEY